MTTPVDLFKDPFAFAEYINEPVLNFLTKKYIYKEEEAGFDPIYNTIIDVLKDNINRPTTTADYDYYSDFFPICWFRASMFVNIFCNEYFQKFFAKMPKPEPEATPEPKRKLIEFTLLLSQVIANRQNTELYCLVYTKPETKTQYVVYMEYIILIYMYLLYNYDNNNFNNTNVVLFEYLYVFKFRLKYSSTPHLLLKGFWPRVYSPEYFTNHFNILFGVQPLVKTDDSSQPPPPSPPSFIVHNFTGKTPIDLFYNYGTTHYVLTSITIDNFNNSGKSGHSVGLYTRNGRFYSWERSISDMFFLEHIILNLDLGGLNTQRMFFNANKGFRIGIYTPSLPVFTSDEVDHLRYLADFLHKDSQNSWIERLFRSNRIKPVFSLSYFFAILLYFLKSFIVTLSDGTSVTMTCVYQSTNTYRLTIDSSTAKTITLTITTIQNFVNAVQSEITTIRNFPATATLVNITMIKARYDDQDETVINMLKIMKLYITTPQSTATVTPDRPELRNLMADAAEARAAAAKGGQRKKKELIMKKTKKVYQIRMNKAKQPYIMMNKQKVLLSEINGRYTLRRD